MSHPVIVAYYFPNYHPDPRNTGRYGSGWTEWELVRRARPRFPGHRLPLVPACGYSDESDPVVMGQKIDDAAGHGIDAFIFDWYYYNDGPFLERALDRGFLGSGNNHRMKFALMWANHDWINIFPASPGEKSPLLYPGVVTPETFDKISGLLLEKYFSHPSYLKRGGCPFFSIYHVENFIRGFGSVDRARVALDDWRRRAVEAGFPGLHLNIIDWNSGLLPGEEGNNPCHYADALGVDSVNAYIWIHYHDMTGAREVDYNEVAEEYFSIFEKRRSTLSAFGRPDIARALVTRHEYPGWGYMINQGGDDNLGVVER